MSPGETTIQIVKIMLGTIALSLFYFFAIRVIELLTVIASK